MPGTPAGAALRGMRIAMMPPAQYPIEVDGAVLAAWMTRRALIELGAEVRNALPVRLPRHDAAQWLIIAEAYALHREYIEDASLPFGKHARRVLAGKPRRGGLCAGAAGARPRLRGLGRMDARRRRAADACLPFAACRLEDVDETATPLAAFTRAGNYVNASGLALVPVSPPTACPSAQLLGRPTARPRWAVSAWPSRPPRTGTCAVRISARSGSGADGAGPRFAGEPLNLRSGHVDAGVRRFADSSLEFSR